MICPNCQKNNMNEYATVCAYCGGELYQNQNAEEKAKELATLQKKDKANSVIKALLAVILAVVIVIVALLIPKPDKDTDTNVPGSTESTTISNSGGDTDSGSDKGETPVTPEESTTLKESKDSKTTAEIVEYFNKNANRVKTEATKVVKNYEKRNINEVVAPAVLQSMADTMADKFMKDDTDPITYSGREAIVENFQVPKQSYVSCLTVNDVTEATFKDMGNYYEVRIVVKNETNPTAGKGVGAAFDVIETNEVEGNSESAMVEKFSTQYSNCTVIAKFDKATNRMTSANYMIPTKLMLTVNMFGTHDISIDMAFEKDYTITY